MTAISWPTPTHESLRILAPSPSRADAVMRLLAGYIADLEGLGVELELVRGR
jgi:hypothetical protein